MAASDNLNEKLFHGTAHWFQPGDTVNPGVTDMYYNRPALRGGQTNHWRGIGAYASTSQKDAEYYASLRLAKQEEDEARKSGHAQQALFAPVFEVEHLSEHSDPAGVIGFPETRRDTKGFRVKGLAGYGVMWED